MPGQRPCALARSPPTRAAPHRYVHVVFTLPRELAPLALQNKRLIYNLLFHSSAAALLEIARDPRHLGAEIGFFSVLHTWDQRLQHHPHVHCVLAAGGLAPDHSRWISSRRSFFLPIKVLRAYNFARRLKTLKGLTPYEYLCKLWTQTPDRFTLDPIHQMPGLNTFCLSGCFSRPQGVV